MIKGNAKNTESLFPTWRTQEVKKESVFHNFHNLSWRIDKKSIKIFKKEETNNPTQLYYFSRERKPNSSLTSAHYWAHFLKKSYK